jgi:hypothetical protein
MQLGVLLVTLQEHSRAATAANWAVPLVGGKEQQEAGASGSQAHPEHDGVLQLRGLWPYWMSGGDIGAVRNDVGLDGFMLLTGPNMAGEKRGHRWKGRRDGGTDFNCFETSRGEGRPLIWRECWGGEMCVGLDGFMLTGPNMTGEMRGRPRSGEGCVNLPVLIWVETSCHDPLFKRVGLFRSCDAGHVPCMLVTMCTHAVVRLHQP